MRVLFVAAHLAGPVVRGDQVRARELLAGLSIRHAVTVVDIVRSCDPRHPGQPGQPTHPTSDSADVDRANNNKTSPVACARYVQIRIHRSAMAMRAALALFSHDPLQASLYDSPTIVSRIERLVCDEPFDVAHLQLARLGPLLRALKPLPVVLDFIDALSSNMRNRAAYDRGPMAKLAAIDAERMARYERALCRRIDLGVVCSNRERHGIGKFENLRVVPMGVATEPPGIGPDTIGAPASLEYAPDSSEPRLIFTGNLGYFPNVDAAAWFIETVMPLLRADIPGVTLELAGARPARRLRELAASNRDVTIAADVTNMRTRIALATIAIAPLRAGSGQQTKVLEAMAMRKPIVASLAAASGIDAVDGEHLLIADTPELMRDAIVRLLRQWPLRMRLADAGRRLVETRHRWDDQIEAMDALWNEAVAGGSGGRRSRKR